MPYTSEDENECSTELALLNHDEIADKETISGNNDDEMPARTESPIASSSSRNVPVSDSLLLSEENKKLRLQIETMKIEMEELRSKDASESGGGETYTLRSIGSAMGSILRRTHYSNSNSDDEQPKCARSPPSTLHHRHTAARHHSDDDILKDDEEALVLKEKFTYDDDEMGEKYPKGQIDPKAKKTASVCDCFHEKDTRADTYDKNSDRNSDYDEENRSDDDFTDTLSINNCSDEDGSHHVTRDINTESFQDVVKDRASWLVGLLILQSCSSFILKNNEKLLQNHSVIVQFLTMLVGAGGNAGNQASVRVIRGLAVGSLNQHTRLPFLKREALMALCLSTILGIAGLFRAAIFSIPLAETVAITASLYMIVIISIFLGALLPLGMKAVGIDPAHSSTTIQVVMDILGVTITCFVSSLILGTSIGARISKLVPSGKL